MEEEHSPFSFEHWVTFVFDHPLPDPSAPHWYHDLDDNSPWWNPSDFPETTVAYLTILFENATSVLAPFSDAQVGQGLWFLVDNSCSDYMFTLLNATVPWPQRLRCISSMYTLFERFFSSMYTLFERFFALRCSPHLALLNEQGASPLNTICYMWWDLLPIHGQPKDHPEVDAACLDVMQSILNLASDPCRESALHGLGHWYFAYPTQVEALIDSFLSCYPDLRSELKAYARDARRGHVL